MITLAFLFGIIPFFSAFISRHEPTAHGAIILAQLSFVIMLGFAFMAVVVGAFTYGWGALLLAPTVVIIWFSGVILAK